MGNDIILKEALFNEGKHHALFKGFLNFDEVRENFPEINFDSNESQQLFDELIRGFSEYNS